ncbi:hypothetical protein SAMN05216573_122100 [Bradyrhizobium sp. Rc3b]|uniref:hypothetical protein n=1 Tax=Bradyrhizobium sp. Rc3b TaxID=1855322 RepID=UPI0008E14CC8|nr:hypothetical protein [Bradyrhizobium sp. Rc3b]SFN81818.1 hypothetical protein SAMN05216573_122100 [Bradyrhizobium sp. Rc3b]
MMERYLADRIKGMLAEPAMGDLITREVSDAELAGWLDRQDMGAWRSTTSSGKPYPLVQERFGIVRGGAGVGKTTVLKAIAGLRGVRPDHPHDGPGGKVWSRPTNRRGRSDSPKCLTEGRPVPRCEIDRGMGGRR